MYKVIYTGRNHGKIRRRVSHWRTHRSQDQGLGQSSSTFGGRWPWHLKVGLVSFFYNCEAVNSHCPKPSSLWACSQRLRKLMQAPRAGSNQLQTACHTQASTPTAAITTLRADTHPQETASAQVSLTSDSASTSNTSLLSALQRPHLQGLTLVTEESPQINK